MGGIGDLDRRNKGGIQIDCHSTIITLPEDFTWVLFLHGDKTSKSPPRGGELTPLGRKQVWDTTWQLIEKFGQDAMNNATYLSLPVYRVRQSTSIALSAIGCNLEECSKDYINKLEWGPNTGHSNDLFAIKELIDYTNISLNEIVLMMGHNGLWENIANIIHPREDGYTINPGEAFIITPSGVEVIRPQITN